MTFISLKNGKFEISSYSNGVYIYSSRGKPMSSEKLRTMGLVPALIERIVELEGIVAGKIPDIIDVSKEYEELRALIDGGSESMTHEDAVKVLERTLFEHDRLRDKIEAAMLTLRKDADET